MAESNETSEEFPWPSKGDRFFVKSESKPQSEPARSPKFEAFLALTKPDLGYDYRNGYYEAGQRLAQGLREDRKNWPLRYPMLYCFRHFIELSLKAVIEVYCRLLEQEPNIAVEKEHGVMKLWNEAEDLMVEAVPANRDAEQTATNVERCLNELNQVDKDSQLFRYPTDRQGQSVEDRLPQIDLDQFLKTMENLQALFDGCEMQAEHLIECRDDVREYYGP